jgi:arylsulfatase A-like enzyme
LACDNALLEPRTYYDETHHLTEDLADYAIRLIQDQQHAAPGKPFFCYFAPAAVHAPHQAPRKWIDSYRGQFDIGWEAYRQETFQRQLEMGVVPADTILTERPPWVERWADLSVHERRVFTRQMETYAGFVSHTDAQIGRFLELLAALDLLDDTVVLLLSDNGAEAGGGPFGMLAADATDVEVMASRIDEFGGTSSRGVYGWGWAVASNTPFRLWKRYSWLGGVRVPLIVHWPRGTDASAKGQIRSNFCHAIDLMPTILDAAGVQPPAIVDGVAQSQLDGRSLLDSFNNPHTATPMQVQYFETRGSRSIYHDGWKATTDHIDAGSSLERDLLNGSHDFGTDRWSLFDVRNDFSEAHDVAEEHPKKLQQMVQMWWHEAGRNQVLPLVGGHPRNRKPSPNHRHRYICRPDAGPCITPTPFMGFGLTADIEVPSDRAASGIICAHHNYAYGFTGDGGWACYAREESLIVVFALAGSSSRLVVDENLRGRNTLRITYTADPDGGSVTVAIDGRCVASRDLPAVREDDYLSEGKLVIGRDSGVPVSDHYQPPFPFTGHIRRIVLDLPNGRRRSPEAELEIARDMD